MEEFGFYLTLCRLEWRNQMESPESFLDHLQYWFAAIASEDIVVTNDPFIEAQANLWTISLTKEMASNLSIRDLCVCVSTFIERKRSEAKRKNLVPLLFYLWFDEQAGQLRFSITSIADPSRLPFQCAINTDAKLSEIASQVLAGPHLDGIPFEELEEEHSNSPRLRLSEPVVLDVFVTKLNS